MSHLSLHEQRITSELIKQGYLRAAASFSAMTNDKISFKPTSFEIAYNDWKVLQGLKSDDQLVLLTTSIIGELNGKSYLLLSQSEAEEIYKACLPYNKNEQIRKKETEALLKELDNILSAAVITEFSNYMNIRIYGDVPALFYTSNHQLRNKIINDFNKSRRKNDYFLVTDTEFISENNSKIRPQFIWKLTQSFINKAKSTSSKQVV